MDEALFSSTRTKCAYNIYITRQQKYYLQKMEKHQAQKEHDTFMYDIFVTDKI